jgi:hypothetical protein
VLKLKVGDEVKLTEGDFVRLSKAFSPRSPNPSRAHRPAG